MPRRPTGMSLAPALGKALLFVLTTAVLFLSPLLASAAESPKRVLIFASEEQQGPGVFIVNQSIRSTLRNGRPAAFLFFYEALDSFRISTEKYEGELVRLLQRKYDGERFDLIYPVGTPALRFLLKHRGELFTDTPLIYVVVDQRQAANLDLGPNVTGVGGKMELAPTLDIALALQPQTQRVVVVAGNASADNTYVALARQEFRPYEGKVEFTYLINLPIEELQKRLAGLPEKSVVFYLSVNSDPTTRIYTSPEVLARLAPSSSVPIYAASQIYIGNGTIGGRLLNLEEIGTRAAEIGLRILAGESAQSIPPQTIPSVDMFDWRELRRWKIDEAKLPPGSVVRFKEFSVWELYKWRIIGAISVMVLQALGIVWLLFLRAKRRQAEEAKKNLAAIVETSDDAILSNNLKGVITSWNAGAEKMFGYSASEIVGQDYSILAPADLKGEVRRILERVSRGESMDHLETVRVSKAGMRIDVSLTISPIKNERGIISGSSSIARDITARKKAEVEALQQRTELAHLSRVTMLGELSGSLAHELNQPLTAILSNAQAAQRFLAHDDVDLDEVRDILGDIVKQDKRAGEVIHRLRLLLKKSTVEHQPLDLNDVVSEVLKLVRNDLLNQRVTGQMELAPELPVIVGDRVQLQQVVLNLVMNGCDAIATGPSGDRRLIIRTELNNGEGICVSVADQGVGLAADNLEKVFEPFFSTKPHGMGLGLSVCRTIIAAHGGKLWAANNAERGATFYFSIPTQPKLQR